MVQYTKLKIIKTMLKITVHTIYYKLNKSAQQVGFYMLIIWETDKDPQCTYINHLSGNCTTHK